MGYLGKRHGIIGFFALLAVLAGCGTSTATGSGAASIPTATSVPTATPVPTASSAAVAACFGPTVSPSQVIQSGDMLISPIGVEGLAWPSVMLPDGTSTDKPYKLTADGQQAYTADFSDSPVVNPTLDESVGGGYSVTICNTSTSQPHTLQAVSARIAAFTPYTGQLNSWSKCTVVLNSHHEEVGTGCGGAQGPCMCFHAVFSSSSAGTTVTMTQNTNMLAAVPSDNLRALPITLKPGQSMRLDLGMGQPQTGMYTFAFGVTFDGIGPIFSKSGPVTLHAPVARKWTGTACEQPALDAQITPTTPETYYICAQ